MNLDIDLKKLRLNIQPHVMAGLLNLNADSDKSFTDLDNLIRSDQNMTALILKAANSSLYTRGKEVTTSQHAISILGFQIVRSLAMTATSKALFESGNYSRFKRLVWEHSVVAGIIANRLCLRINKTELKEEAFIAGLLHDIGKVLLNIIDRKKFIEVINVVEGEKIPFADAEKRVFGFDHLELGALASSEWNLPEVYRPVISSHMDMNDSAALNGQAGDLLRIVSYSNYLAKKNGYGSHSEADEDDARILEEQLKLGEADINFFTKDYQKTIVNDEFYKFFMTVI